MVVVYSEAQMAPAQGGSSSAAKPGPVVAAWRALDPALRLIAPSAITREQLALAHDRDFVDRVLDGRTANGFGTLCAAVNRSLPYTSGAMLDAARLAIAERSAVAAPVSGFHHAGWDFAGGFCTFNGLLVTALVLRREGLAHRVGILDYDMHYGNGTVDIIDRLALDWVVHITAGATFEHVEQADIFLANIERDLESLANCDVVLYQAGADPHIDDPLGGFLTTEQLEERDRRVFQGLHDRGLPVAWNLAGGYQQPLSKVIAIHANTYRACRAIWE